MKYAFDRLQAQVVSAIQSTGIVPDTTRITVEEPKPEIPFDLTFPTFVSARASDRKNPAEFARFLADAVRIPDESLIGAVQAVGPFVNISVEPGRYAKAVIDEVLTCKDRYGNDDLGEHKLVIVEFSSPNIARKMHVGHLRTTIIGNALRKIMQALGYHVVADNHLGDWGTQFGSLLAAHALWGWPPEMESHPAEALVQIYQRFHEEAKNDPALRDLAREWFLRLEQGDEQSRAIWKQLIAITLKEFEATYEMLGITFDTWHGESFYEPMLTEVVQEAIDKSVAKVEPDGAVSVSFDDQLPSYLIRRRDGATLYQTRDIAACIYRWREYAPLRNIYVVGQEQTLHFQQVFETVRRMGYTEIADRSIHISFGVVRDAEGERFSMREGTAIFLDEVLEEAILRARTVIEAKVSEGKSELPAEQHDAIARMIGIGSVIYNDLRQGPGRNIRFDWDEMLSFEGDSAPYIQYTHARCCSILRKAGEAREAMDTTRLTSPEEQAVIKQLGRLPQTIRLAGNDLSSVRIADWVYQTARAFGRFYHEAPVLEAPPELRSARLSLVEATAQGLRNALALLGIAAPEQM